MSTDNDNTVALDRVGDLYACPACGGPTSRHEETIIMLGHPDRVRHRYICVDRGCGASFLVEAATGVGGNAGVSE